MSQHDETTPALGSQQQAHWPPVVPAEVAADRQVQQTADDRCLERHGAADDACGYFSLDEVADDVGGLPEEIREWVRTGAVTLEDPVCALAGRWSERDLARIERHQVTVDIQRCVKDPDKFLDTRFERFGDKTPRELLQDDDIDLVRDLVWHMKSGAIS